MQKMTMVFLFLFLFVFSTITGFSQNRQALIEQINQLKTDYYQEKYEIDEQIRELGRDWHIHQMKMHQEIKANPERARGVRAELWQGARKLSQKKKALYGQLTPLRKDWYNKRMAIEAKIAQIDDEEKAQWD